MTPTAVHPPYCYLFRKAELLLRIHPSYQLIRHEEITLFETSAVRVQPVDKNDPNGDIWGELEPTFEPPSGYAFFSLRSIPEYFDYSIFTRAGLAFQLMDWERNSRFCSRCGLPLRNHPQERAKECPSCNMLVYPTLSPAIIVAVERDNRLLLARSPHFSTNRVSVLAGFVEPGETLEQAVHREVHEETGIRIRTIRYFDSQPWPFPHSLMLGFTAEWEAGEIQIDGIEIEQANWYTAEEIPPLPSSVSIARRLIDHWIRRQERRKTT